MMTTLIDWRVDGDDRRMRVRTTMVVVAEKVISCVNMS